MRILIDSNIFIYCEDPKIISDNLQRLLSVINENNHTILIHPASFDEINNDQDIKRKNFMLSKIKTYPLLESPSNPDIKFLNTVGRGVHEPITYNDKILFAVSKSTVDILITEDKGIEKNALKLGIESNVMDILTALIYFENIHYKKPISHVIIKDVPTSNIDVNDPIFDSLREDYPNFNRWFEEKCVKEGRRCWVYSEGDRIQAILIYKKEDEAITDITPILPRHKRLKISTLKVALQGNRIGELLLKLAIRYCVNNNIDETYLTHFVKEQDPLVKLIEEFGFECIGNNVRGEAVYLKKLIPAHPNVINPVEMSRKFYPSFKDGNNIKKFIVPIIPEYHNRLFQDYEERQWEITEYVNVNPQGNTIRKAYLSNSLIKKIRPGDILLFYRSRDQHKITSIGVTESVYLSLTNSKDIWNLIGSNRSVYTREEIEAIKKPVTVIIFRHHFNFNHPLDINQLIANNILVLAPRSIIEIDNKKYEYIKSNGGINEYFTFD
jgi:rRNA-processing protein FCF1